MVEKFNYYDFSAPLQIEYCTADPYGEGMTIGYCVVEKADGKFAELHINDHKRGYLHDEDYYGMHEPEIFMWDFQKSVEKPILFVYVDRDWSDIL